MISSTGIALLSLTAMIAAIFVLSVITDEFFIPSLDKISNRWELPPDVAGASLMAVGSSAPELSIALFALFTNGGAHSDVGIGTIVGSAVFNILVITGVSAAIREARITLPAIIRDTFFYLGSIIGLLAVFWDGRVNVGECLFLIAFYAGYLAFLFFVDLGKEPEMTLPERPPVGTEFATPKAGQAVNRSAIRRLQAAIHDSVGKATGDPSENYMRAFGVSIFFICVLSYVLVEMAVIFSDAVGLPPVIVALTILAAGTSAPDLLASMAVAKQGRGSMAVANAIGSNIFDILICLGLPWLLALLFLGMPVIEVGTGDLIPSVLILISTVVVLFYFLWTDRTLARWEGWILILLYGAYVVMTVMTGGAA